MSGSFARLFGQLSQQLAAHPEQTLELSLANVSGFRCQQGGKCCRNPWKVDVDEAYYQTWQHKLQAFAGLDRPALVVYTDAVLAQGAHAYITKQPGSHTCVFQAQDNSCRIHSELGEAALPQLCRSFPREVSRVGERLSHVTLSSACEHAAAMLDEQADLSFRIIPQTAALAESSLLLHQQRALSLPAFLPWLGWILDRVFDFSDSPQEALHDSADLLLAALHHPEQDLADWLESGWTTSPRLSDSGPALQLFCDNMPFSEQLRRYLQRQQRLRRPWPVLELRTRQRISRFERQYLLRRLLSLDLLSEGALSLSQYLWLMSFGLLSIRVLLYYRLGETNTAVSLADLVWCLNRWESMGMQHPHWLRQIGLASWDDEACLLGIQQLGGFGQEKG